MLAEFAAMGQGPGEHGVELVLVAEMEVRSEHIAQRGAFISECDFVAGVGVELMCDGPAADAGAVGFEVEPAMGFTGHGAASGRWLAGKEFGDQGGDWGGPIRLMIPAGATGRPGVGTALRAGKLVVGAQWVEAADADAQFERDGCGRGQAAAGAGEEMADQWRGDAVTR